MKDPREITGNTRNATNTVVPAVPDNVEVIPIGNPPIAYAVIGRGMYGEGTTVQEALATIKTNPLYYRLGPGVFARKVLKGVGQPPDFELFIAESKLSDRPGGYRLPNFTILTWLSQWDQARKYSSGPYLRGVEKLDRSPVEGYVAYAMRTQSLGS